MGMSFWLAASLIQSQLRSLAGIVALRRKVASIYLRFPKKATDSRIRRQTACQTQCCLYIIIILSCHKKVLFYLATWLELVIVMLSEINQTQKAKPSMVSLKYGVGHPGVGSS